MKSTEDNIAKRKCGDVARLTKELGKFGLRVTYEGVKFGDEERRERRPCVFTHRLREILRNRAWREVEEKARTKSGVHKGWEGFMLDA